MLNDAEGNTKPAKLSRPNKTSVVETSVSEVTDRLEFN